MFKFRKASITDVDSIIRVMQNTNYSKLVYPKKTFSEIKDIISNLIKTQICLVCVDSRSNDVVGYFIIDSLKKYLDDVPKKIKLDKKYAYNAGIGIHSNFRGNGLAFKLTKYAIRIAKNKNYLGMYAAVGSNNEASIKLQEKCGFSEIIRYDCSWRPKNFQNIIFEIKF